MSYSFTFFFSPEFTLNLDSERAAIYWALLKDSNGYIPS